MNDERKEADCIYLQQCIQRGACVENGRLCTYPTRRLGMWEEENKKMENDEKEPTVEEHRARHQQLHEALDELIADYAFMKFGIPGRAYCTDSFLSTTSVLDLMKWSHEQTISPTDRREMGGIKMVKKNTGEK